VDYFLQQLVSGLSIGLVYGGLALALVLVFKGTGIVNFAQAEMAGLTAFVDFTLLAAGLPWWVALLGAAAAGFAVGAVVERVLVRPVERRSELTRLIVTIALLLGVNATTRTLWGRDPRMVTSPFGEGTVSAGVVMFTDHRGSEFGRTPSAYASARSVQPSRRGRSAPLRSRGRGLHTVHLGPPALRVRID
jgi:branched-chain amino acid transport system permease protein